jgi:predicted acetylornithine/succinylornithine family transaminase
MDTFEQIVDREQRYLVHTYARYPLAIARGKGVFVYDVEGRRYLDLVGGLGVNALGHAHPRIVKAIREQAARAIHVSNLYYHEYQGVLAERLTRASGLDRTFFSNSGTEAIEGALKLARIAGHKVSEGKCNLVALAGSFHGRTFGAMSLTGQEKYRKGFEPMLEGVRFIPLNDPATLREAVDDSTCAIVLETIQGEGGIRECSTEFLKAAREAADRHGAALILDEIQCGLGRTGSMFAYQQHNIVPDIVTIAKPLAAGLPLGAFIAKEKFASAITPGKHGTTFGGGPLTTRTALEYLSIIEDEQLLERVTRVGAYMHDAFVQLKQKFPSLVNEARGRGMIQALELTVPGRPIVDAALAEGVLLNVTQDTTLRFLPPFLLEEKHVDKAVRVLKKLLGKQQKVAKQEVAATA